MNEEEKEQTLLGRVAQGELLKFTAEERAELVRLKRAFGLTAEQAEAAVVSQERSDRAKAEPEAEAKAEPEAEAKAEPEPPAAPKKGKK